MSSKASEFRVGPNRKSNSSSIISSSWSPQAGDPTLSARKSGLSSDPQSVSAFAPLKSIPRSNQTSVQSSSSGLLQSSQWMDQSPQSVATPPPSTGEPMSIATKKNWTASQPQASPAYRRSPSWNATPPSILSSSPLSSSSSAWTLSSSSAAAPPQSSQSWSGPHHSTPQDPSWRVSPSVTNAGVESWGKDYFPNPSLTDSRRQDAVLTSPIDPTVQNFSGHQHYGSLESTLYSAQHDEPLNTNNATYGTGSQPDTDLTETRQENLIQGFLRHVSANTASFNQELSGFNLGQQDFAYLERGLRQALSPTALLSAVEAYDDSGQDTGACQDSSLQDSINLVHTVNLDMEEGNLDGSSNLGLVNLNGHPATQVNIPRNMDGLTKTSQSGMQSLMESDLGSTTLNDSTSSIDGTSLVGSPLAKGITDGEEKKEEKKAMKERKHQYDIIVNDGVRKFKCKICNKSFGKTTIYRHLRIHDSDYRISCTLCEKQYTQKHSLMLHMQKFHGEVNTSLLSPDKKDPGDTAVKEEDKTSPNKPSEAKRQRRSSSTADPLAASLDENELLKQKETHRQVEELRRLKAEKKAHGKSGLHSADDASARDDGLSPCKEGEGEFPVKNFGIVRAPLTGHQTNITELSNTVPDRTDVDNSVGYKGASGGSLGPQVGSSQTAPQILSGSKPQFQLNSPLPVMSTIAPFQTVDPALKPVSTPATGTPDEIPNNWDTAPGVASEKSFPSQADLKNFLCTVCNTQLVSRNGFTLHMRRHNVAKSKLCTSCDKKFHTTTELKTHMRTHTGERPFKCELCYMSFAHSGSFVCHKKGHTNRGELEPFPIIDGQIKYPSTFRKPRMEGIKKVLGKGGDQKKEPKKKTNNESQEVGGHGVSDAEPSSIPRQDSLSGGHHTSVIRKNSLDGSFEKHAVSSRNDSDLPRKLGLNSQDMNSSGDGVMGLSGQIFNPNVPASSRVKDGGGYLQAGDGYSTPQQDIVSGYSTPRHDITSSYSTPRPDVTGGYSTPNQVDYYSGQSGYSETSQQRNFLSPQAETSSSHSYYNQEKYYARAASGDQFSPGSSSGQLRSVPVNLVVDKSQHYSEGMQGEYPESVETADGYYSSQQPYQYAMPPGDADYEQEDYDGALSQYKGDPSSSEIVKKLLQHYNVPSSTYQEAAPLDYSHQLQGAPDYSRASGETAPPIYAEQELGVAAPPSYSASVQQKQFYGSHTNTPEYDGTLMMSSDRAAPLPSPQGSSLQTAQERSYSRSTASIQQAEAYSLEPRYSTADNFHDGQYARSPSQPYTQTYEVTSRDYYQQGLPKIESLARDTDPNSRDPVTKSQ
ncbi:unnamed protein product [Lymnaea stagnalis]|uniref:C2H2-type domain-containing protein n=1 Tax=Lymnaea stagnalis TaxID=6523 RepID=A0AAV2HR97_LYMST